jgi:hypothetical protein
MNGTGQRTSMGLSVGLFQCQILSYSRAPLLLPTPMNEIKRRKSNNNLIIIGTIFMTILIRCCACFDHWGINHIKIPRNLQARVHSLINNLYYYWTEGLGRYRRYHRSEWAIKVTVPQFPGCFCIALISFRVSAR